MKDFSSVQKLSPRVSIEKDIEIETPFNPAIFSFPQQLFHLLQIAENNDQEDTISWAQDGKSFTVHDLNEFEVSLLTKYSQMNKYASFTRQLCAYGFSCVRQGRKPGRCKTFEHWSGHHFQFPPILSFFLQTITPSSCVMTTMLVVLSQEEEARHIAKRSRPHTVVRCQVSSGRQTMAPYFLQVLV